MYSLENLNIKLSQDMTAPTSFYGQHVLSHWLFLLYLDGTPYLDGGLSDSIPFEKAFEDGCDRVIVVLTREAGYQKQTNSSVRTLARAFLKYPEIQRDILLPHHFVKKAFRGFLQIFDKQFVCALTGLVSGDNKFFQCITMDITRLIR